MHLLGNCVQFTAIAALLVLIVNILPIFIFQLYTWIAHVFLCINISMWTLLLTEDYFFVAKVNPKNKAVLITGCDTGFGNAMAKTLDKRGYKVFACCLDKRSDGASELIETCSNNLSVIQMDVTDEESVARAVKFVRDDLESTVLWAIVNNAGVLRGFQTELSTMNDYEKCLQVNTLGMIRVTKALLPMLRKSRGRVINMCSLAGRLRIPFKGAYDISKSAAVAFSEVLRQEMRDFGVRVISIEPEFFRTLMCSEDYVEYFMKKSFSGIDEEVLSAYGNEYIENAKKIYHTIFSMSSPNVQRVHEAIESSVSLRNPADIYRPTRNIYLKCLFMLGERVPQVFNEIALKITFTIMGLPSPQEGGNILSRLFNM